MAERRAITEVPCRSNVVVSVGNGVYTDDDGWSLGLPDDVGFEVEPGMTVDQWGKGIGFTVRGLAINDRVIYYRTEAEQEALDALQRRRSDAAKVETYVDERSKLDADYEALPIEFRRRIDRFRAGCPEFRWEFEAYELSVCTDAVKIAEEFGGKADLISEYARWPYERQMAEVEGLFDGHSGNSFSCAVQLARVWSTKPEAVIDAHGALAPLVGCEAYGCTHPTEVSDA